MFTYLFSFISSRVGAFGKKPLCNMRPNRAPRWREFCFPLCWRCTSIVLTMILFGKGIGQLLPLPLNGFIIAALILPMSIDGIAQYRFKIESTNFRRIVTGFFAGIGIEMAARYFIQ